MKYFNLSSSLGQEALKTREDRLCARTKMGKQQFAQAVRTAGLTLLSPKAGLSLDDNPEALVIGIATYSDPDLEALDQAMPSLQTREQVFIFDIDDCSNLADVRSVMPHSSLFSSAPVIAFYRDSRLFKVMQGKDALHFLIHLTDK